MKLNTLNRNRKTSAANRDLVCRITEKKVKKMEHDAFVCFLFHFCQRAPFLLKFTTAVEVDFHMFVFLKSVWWTWYEARTTSCSVDALPFFNFEKRVISFVLNAPEFMLPVQRRLLGLFPIGGLSLFFCEPYSRDKGQQVAILLGKLHLGATCKQMRPFRHA